MRLYNAVHGGKPFFEIKGHDTAKYKGKNACYYYAAFASGKKGMTYF